ncbi:MAG TPA: hypothetical protein VMW72_22200, partial [Sedimentisphaerales bacterium]|nr:hypothetical protein [Sedimentisphaerales bacterium]
FQYAVILLWSIFSPKAVMAAKLLAVESQLAVCKQQIASKKHPRPRFTAGFRLPYNSFFSVGVYSAARCPSNGYP